MARSGWGNEESDPLMKDVEQHANKLHVEEERHKASPPQKLILGVPASVFAGGLYCCASMGMVSGCQGTQGHTAL